MQKVLVGYDGSEPAARALSMGTQLAEKFGAELVLVHAVPTPVFPPEAYVGVLEIERLHREAAQRMLDEQVKKLERPGLVVHTRVLEGGTVAGRLSDFAQEEGADVVVVGSLGKSAVSRMLLGSVSSKLVHLCPRPVLVVR